MGKFEKLEFYHDKEPIVKQPSRPSKLCHRKVETDDEFTARLRVWGATVKSGYNEREKSVWARLKNIRYIQRSLYRIPVFIQIIPVKLFVSYIVSRDLLTFVISGFVIGGFYCTILHK